MKIFISQPMAGKSDSEIQRARTNAICTLTDNYSEIEILDTVFKDYDGNAVQFLGKSISKLAEADMAVFLNGWQIARGCRAEEMVAYLYGIPSLFL